MIHCALDKHLSWQSFPSPKSWGGGKARFARSTHLTDQPLEVSSGAAGAAPVDPVQVRVEGEVAERLPGGLVAADVDLSTHDVVQVLRVVQRRRRRRRIGKVMMSRRRRKEQVVPSDWCAGHHGDPGHAQVVQLAALLEEVGEGRRERKHSKVV